MTSVYPGLDQAFRQTDYRVYLPREQVTVRIGEIQPVLCRWLEQQGFETCHWSIITACNPGANPLSDQDNGRRQAELEVALSAGQWPWRPSVAVDPDGQWPDEPGAWIAGIPAQQACRLAAEYGQLALVSADARGLAQLEYL